MHFSSMEIGQFYHREECLDIDSENGKVENGDGR
jgi:hypothetical protein